MYIHRLRKTTMGNGGSMTKRFKNASVSAPSMRRIMGSGITSEVYTTTASRPTQVLSNIRVAKSRLPKKYITFD